MRRLDVWIPAHQQSAANAWMKANVDPEGGELTFTVPRWKKNRDPDTDPPDYFTCSMGGITQDVFDRMSAELSKAKYKSTVSDGDSKKHSDKEKEMDVKNRKEKLKILKTLLIIAVVALTLKSGVASMPDSPRPRVVVCG